MPGSNGSGGNALEQNGGEPFGFLKTSAGGGGVSLIVLPYAFPKLWALLGKKKNRRRSESKRETEANRRGQKRSRRNIEAEGKQKSTPPQRREVEVEEGEEARRRKCILSFYFLILFFFFPDELSVVHKMIPNAKWRSEFDRYVSSIPPYYIPPLRTGKGHKRKETMRRKGGKELFEDFTSIPICTMILLFLSKNRTNVFLLSVC